MDICKLPRIWPTYYGICLGRDVHLGMSNPLLEGASAMILSKCMPQIPVLFLANSGTILLGS